MSTFNYSDEYIYNSCHSYRRCKERAGLSRKRAERMIELARERGIECDDCSWSIDKHFLEHKSDSVTKAVAYNGYCFILDRESLACITMFSLPKYFGKKKTFYGSKDRDFRMEYEMVY